VACNNGDNASIVDCLLVNPYYAVDFATQRSGRHYIRNLYGQPLKRGITIDQCYDVGRIENVHFWPFWTWDNKSGIKKWLWDNGEAFVFGRTDWEYVLNTFCFGYKVGYRFTGTEHGVCNGNFLGIGCDGSVHAVVVDKCSPNGLLITNGEFVAFAKQDPISLVVGKENEGLVQLVNCAFWGPSSQIARIEGTGSVTFQGCNIRDYDRLGMGRPTIELLGGHLMVSNSLFTRPSPQLIVGEGAGSAIVMGNRFAGPQCIQWPDGVAVQIGLNVENSDGLALKAPQPTESRTEEAEAIVMTVSSGEETFTSQGTWYWARAGSDYAGESLWAPKGANDCTATFRPDIPQKGQYTVFLWYGEDPNHDHASNMPVTVKHAKGETKVTIDLTKDQGKWNQLGDFFFKKGQSGAVMVSNEADGNVMADAVKIVPRREK